GLGTRPRRGISRAAGPGPPPALPPRRTPDPVVWHGKDGNRRRSPPEEAGGLRDFAPFDLLEEAGLVRAGLGKIKRGFPRCALCRAAALCEISGLYFQHLGGGSRVPFPPAPSANEGMPLARARGW